MKNSFIALLLLPNVLISCVSCFGQGGLLPTGAVEYEVEVVDSKTAVFRVFMKLRSTLGPLSISMPMTTPGSAAVENNARYFLAFEAMDAASSPLKWKRVDKQTWEIDVFRPGMIMVQYEVQPNTSDKRRLSSALITTVTTSTN